MKYLIIILSILICLFLILSIIIKERKKSLYIQAISNVFEFIYNVLINAYTAAGLTILNVFRTYLFLNIETINHIVYKLILVLLQLITIINCYFTWDGYVSLLATIGTLFRTYALWQKNMLIVRISGATTGILYGLYFLYYKSYILVFGDIILLIISLLAIYKYDIKRIEKNNK